MKALVFIAEFIGFAAMISGIAALCLITHLMHS